MAYRKAYFGKFSDFLTSKRFIVAWSVFYVLFLLLNWVRLIYKGAYIENGDFADLFINYSGGFVRRGLLGQLLLWCHQVGLNPMFIAVAVVTFAFLTIVVYMLLQFKKRKYSWCLLTVGWLLGGYGSYGFCFMRRDYIIMCFFLLIVWLWKRLGTTAWIVLANIIVCATILCYEPFALFSVPFCILLARLRLNNWCRSVACWVLPMITFLACCKYAGGKEVYDAIVASTEDFLPLPGMMGFLLRGSVDVMKFHLHCNFLNFQHGVPVVLLSVVSLSAMLYYCVNAVPVFTQEKQDFANRRYILAFMLCAFFVLLPMFTCLSTDYARTCVYVSLSSFILFFNLDEEERSSLLPSIVYLWADKLLCFSDRHLRPTRFKIVFIMLFIGVFSWTGGALRGFLGHSEMGYVAYNTLQMLKKLYLLYFESF